VVGRVLSFIKALQDRVKEIAKEAEFQGRVIDANINLRGLANDIGDIRLPKGLDVTSEIEAAFATKEDLIVAWNKAMDLAKALRRGDKWAGLLRYAKGLVGKAVDAALDIYGELEAFVSGTIFDVFEEMKTQFWDPAMKLVDMFKILPTLVPRIRIASADIRKETRSVFAPKWDKKFVKKERGCSAECDCGPYPATAGGKYDTGVGVVGYNEKIIAPFTAMVVAKTGDSITLDPFGTRFGPITVTIHNVCQPSIGGLRAKYLSKLISFPTWHTTRQNMPNHSSKTHLNTTPCHETTHSLRYHHTTPPKPQFTPSPKIDRSLLSRPAIKLISNK